MGRYFGFLFPEVTGLITEGLSDVASATFRGGGFGEALFRSSGG
jgi:hypothetical protein